MSSIVAELAALLDKVERPGHFHASGTCDIHAPRLEVDGVGAVALPILPVQARELIGVAERAPYGRGEQTLVDTDVRRTWQIDPRRIRIQGLAWERSLATIVEYAAEGLGVTGTVTAEFYKMLIYDEGSFFVGHRDSEKTPGMFATLVIVLPSVHAGGELVIRHQGREVRLDPRGVEPSEVGFIAFYADCEHEVRPVTSGHRLTLVYNLLRKGKPLLPPDYSGEHEGLVALLKQWSAAEMDGGYPRKLIHPLEHAYTEAGLSFATLKGADAGKASVLLGACRSAGCDLHLALVSIEETGAAEYVGDYGRYRRGRRDREFEVGEIIDRFETLSQWQTADGSATGLGTLPIKAGEVSPADAFDDMVPDEESFEEATGNAGASFERRYRVAALVLWPRHRRFAVIEQGGLGTTLPYLTDLAERWSRSGEDRSSPLWQQGHELAGLMLSSWSVPTWPTQESPSNAAKLLTLLYRLGDVAHIDAFLADAVARGAFGMGDSRPILKALQLLPTERAADLLQRIVTGNAAKAFDACADLIARGSEMGSAWINLVPAATALVAALPGAPTQPSAPSWQQPRTIKQIKPGMVADLLLALAKIDPVLADSALDSVLAWPATYDPDKVLVPAALALLPAEVADAPAIKRLIAGCVAHLQARVDEPLAPPADWRRPDPVDCKCEYCRSMGAFLVDPALPTWNFKSLQANREHVEETIRRNQCDLDTRTVRSGSPHTLVCSKNQASFERRAKQRVLDLGNLAKLAGC